MDRAERRPDAGRLSRYLVVGALLLLAAAGLVRSGLADGPVTEEQRSEQLASSLRCPTCQGLSVADSNSPLAQSMRGIIEERVAAGESDAVVRQFFVDRYGEWVLLAPPASGSGWLVWAVPVLAVLLGVAVAAQRVGRRGGRGTGVLPAVPQPVRWVGAGSVLAVALGVLVTTNMGERAADGLPTGTAPVAAQGPAAGPDGTAVGSGVSARARLQTLRAAVTERPDDVGLRLALASTAFESGRPGIVRTQATAVLDRQPDNVDALLLRGLAARSSEDGAAVAALRRFLDLAPKDHPGLPLVRTVLGGRR